MNEGNEGDEGNEGNEGMEGNEGNEGNEGDEGNEGMGRRTPTPIPLPSGNRCVRILLVHSLKFVRSLL